MEIKGRAAVVLPDNVLFEGGAGEAIRRQLLKEVDVHSLLRLPTGIFYAGGVKANVLFFDKRAAGDHPWTEKLWVYDFRTNQHFTLKPSQLCREHLQDLVGCYLPDKARSERVETGRFKAFTCEELIARDKVNLELIWLKDDSLEDLDNLPAPEIIAREIVEDLTAALVEFEAVAAALKANAGPATRSPPTRPCWPRPSASFRTGSRTAALRWPAPWPDVERAVSVAAARTLMSTCHSLPATGASGPRDAPTTSARHWSSRPAPPQRY